MADEKRRPVPCFYGPHYIEMPRAGQTCCEDCEPVRDAYARQGGALGLIAYLTSLSPDRNLDGELRVEDPPRP